MQFASSTGPAEALMKRLDGGPTVAGLVPRGYDRYLRVLSPVGVRSSSEPGALELRVPWSPICEHLGLALEANTLWQRDIVSADRRVADFQEPGLSPYDIDVAERVGSILQWHETADRAWYFASWVGYGIAQGERSVWFPSHHHDALELSVFERWNEATAPFAVPLVPSAPGSSMLLAASGHHPPAVTAPPGQLPMYWWPEGDDWVLGQALYGRSLYLACNDAIADEVLATAGIEVLEVDLSDEADHEE